jgi:hypothetical protein
MKLIAAGKAQPVARSRAGSKRVIEDELELQHQDEVDDVVLHDVEERFVFVEDDEDGALVTPPRSVAGDAPPTRKQKSFKTGTNRKNQDLQVVDTYGPAYPAADGAVKINLAKLVLRPVTEAEVEAKKYLMGRES